ncbi:hypothetical protein V8E36_002366 [Tilletia maclaganii]
MLSRSTHQASGSLARLCNGSRSAVASSAARRTAAEPIHARLLSTSSGGSSSSLAASSPSTARATAVALGVVGGLAFYFTALNGSGVLHQEGRPSYGDRLKQKSKPAASKSSAKEESGASKQKQSDTPVGKPEDEEEAAKGTGAFTTSLSETVAAPEAAEIVVEGSETSSNQSAYNPDTGEINWDCPCLGGMAHGSCGEQFKAAFSCFVYSEKEPKGIECVEHFKAMQDCFRKHPEEYAEEIADDERAAAEDEAEQHAQKESAAKGGSDNTESKSSKASAKSK